MQTIYLANNIAVWNFHFPFLSKETFQVGGKWIPFKRYQKQGQFTPVSPPSKIKKEEKRLCTNLKIFWSFDILEKTKQHNDIEHKCNMKIRNR